MPSVYRIVKTKKKLKELIRHCEKTGYASIDFETNAMPINHDLFYPTILGVSFQVGSAWIIPLEHFDSPFKGNWQKLFKRFCDKVIENKDIVKIAWNAKFEYKIFKRYNVDVKGRFFDGMLAKYLLDEERPMGLKSQVDRFIPEFAGYSENYDGAKLPWAEKPLKGLSKYCALDCDLTLRLMLFFEQRLMDHELYPLFRNMLMMGVRVLGDSEYSGMNVDTVYLDHLMDKYEGKIAISDKKLREVRHVAKFEKWLVGHKINKLVSKISEEINDLNDELDEIESDIRKTKDPKEIRKLETAYGRKEKSIAGREDKIDRYMVRDMRTKTELKCLEPINFNSPDQLKDLLFLSPQGYNFEIVKYTINKDTKRETDRPSTDEEVLTVLEEFDNTGFCKELLELRGLSKIYSTYVKGIKEKVCNAKIHARFKLEGTVTGRLSSADPNLQNIPRDTTAKDIKRMFKPPKGYLLLQLDYSQAELRVMAAQAGEETMIRWFKEGKDIHLTTALKMYGQEDRYEEISEVLDIEDDNDPRFEEWKVKRKYAKTINFGIIYGQGIPKLAAGLGWEIPQAKKFLDDYFKLFPKIKKFIAKQHAIAHDKASIRNVFGRKRRLPNIDSREKWEAAEAERQSVNAPIQGAASDYTLFSSILIWEEVRDGKIKMDYPQCYTVHDSIGYYVHPDHVHEVIPKLEAICANPQTMEWFNFQIDDVVMKVDFEVSHESWGHLKTYHPEMDYSKIVKDYTEQAA